MNGWTPNDWIGGAGLLAGFLAWVFFLGTAWRGVTEKEKSIARAWKLIHRHDSVLWTKFPELMSKQTQAGDGAGEE